MMAGYDYEGFWNETLHHLRSELGEEEFGAWFTDIRYVRSGENSIVLGFPSNFHRDRIKARYQNGIKTKLKGLAGKDVALEFEIIPDSKMETAVSAPQPAAAEPAADKPPAEKPKKKRHPHMQEDYSFEKFIIGENNNFAANAALAISRNPGTAYNPFLIYGGVGLGKTHLMQAIGNHIHENSDHKVIYVSSEDFLNEYVKALREKEMPTFKNKFRYADVLLIDDVQFFQAKEQIQEEFFHTFNTLLHAKKQLVMTCDRPPSELKKLDDRLSSRFGQGLTVDLQPPRYEVRCAILKSTAESRGAIIPDEVIDLISKNISSNVRDLIGALQTLISYTEIMGQPVTLEIAQQKLRDVLASTRQANLSIEIIQKVVADFYSLSVSDLRGKKRTQKIVYPRQLSMFICREITDFSTTEIGEAFGGRDHTTVMHSIDKIQGLLITDPALDSTVENLKRQIKELSAKS
jgi:chromosomal replication initiator protein